MGCMLPLFFELRAVVTIAMPLTQTTTEIESDRG